MALSNARKVVVGETPYAHEREALDFAFSVLPDSDPFQVWALTELLEPSSGRLYELDLLVLGYSAHPLPRTSASSTSPPDPAAALRRVGLRIRRLREEAARATTKAKPAVLLWPNWDVEVESKRRSG